MESENSSFATTYTSSGRLLGSIKEAILLAGMSDPQQSPGPADCLLPVAGRPVLFHLINYLRSQGVENFIFASGNRHKEIENYLTEHFSSLDYQSFTEDESLGTGGAILQACSMAIQQQVVVAYTNSFFKANLHDAGIFHINHMAECSLLLKPMKGCEGYSVVEMDAARLVTGFSKKNPCLEGYISPGLYLLDKSKFLDEEFPRKFSFEKDYLWKYHKTRRIYGIPDDVAFIDYSKPGYAQLAQKEFAKAPLNLKDVDDTWTLFLDRDGVINHEKRDCYILNWEEFEFYTGVKETFHLLANKFGKIIIVSNQRGVGKELMADSDLRDIHVAMKQEIETAGGRIDHIYCCTSIDPKHPDRKPNPGMAFHARSFFPEVDFSKAIIVGNKLSDMEFGKNAGIYTVFAATTHPETAFPHPDIDLRFQSLPDFARFFSGNS